MSEDCIKTFANNKDMEISVRNENDMISHCQYQWMAHWTQASGNSAPQGHKSSNSHNAKDKDTCVSQHEYLQVGNNKSAKLKMVSMGVNHEGTSEYKNICRSDIKKIELRVDTHQSIDAVGGDKEKDKVDRSSSQKSFKSCDTEVASDTLSLSELPGAFKDHGACCCLHSEDVCSEWNHFPVYGINQRVHGTLHSRKGLGHGQRSVASSSRLPPRETTFDTHMVKFTAEKHHLDTVEFAARVNQETEPLKFIKCTPPCLDDGTGSMLHIFSDKFKFQNTSMGPPTRGKEKMEHVDSDYVFHVNSLKASLANMNHEICKYSGHSKWKLCEMEDDNDLIANEVRSSWSRMKIGSIEVQRDCVSGDFTPFSLGRYIDETRSTEMKDVTSNSPDDLNGGFKISSDMAWNKSITKMATELPAGEQTISDSTYLSKSRGTALFEMLMVPRSHAKQYGYSQISDTDSGTKFETHNAGSSKSSVRTDTMSIDSYRMPKSQQVTISSSPNKDHLFHNLLNSNSASASPMRPACPASLEVKLPDASEKKKDPSASITESISFDQDLSYGQRPHASNSTSITDSSWLKRLRPNTSDSQGNKRLKIGGGPTTGEPHHLFSEVVKPNFYSSSIMDCHKEQMHDKTKQLQSSLDGSAGVSDKEIRTWVGRWLRKNPQTAQPEVKEAASAICGTENSKALTEHYEGKQFPSIATLALMGKAMNNLRTREFQRRGSSVVWNTGLLS